MPVGDPQVLGQRREGEATPGSEVPAQFPPRRGHELDAEVFEPFQRAPEGLEVAARRRLLERGGSVRQSSPGVGKKSGGDGLSAAGCGRHATS